MHWVTLEGNLSLLGRSGLGGMRFASLAFFRCSKIRNVYLFPGERSLVSTEKVLYSPKFLNQKKK